MIADLEKGVRPWLKPWNASHAIGRITLPLRQSGTPYRGINVLLLWGETIANGYSSPIWMTFRQALAAGAHVRKGEHGATVDYADRFTRTEADENGNDVEREIPFLKPYTVFNAPQVDGLPSHYYHASADESGEKLRLIEQAERFFAATGATIRRGGRRRSASPSRAVIRGLCREVLVSRRNP